MKKINKLIMMLVLGFIMFSAAGYAQSHNHVVKINPGALIAGQFNATYEKVTGTRSSLLFSGHFMNKLLGENVKAVGVGAGYRYYLIGSKANIPSGFWLTPQAAVAFGKSDNNALTTLTGGLEVGYQYIMDSGFAIDVGVGPSYSLISGDKTLGKTAGLNPTISIAIGYAF